MVNLTRLRHHNISSESCFVWSLKVSEMLSDVDWYIFTEVWEEDEGNMLLRKGSKCLLVENVKHLRKIGSSSTPCKNLKCYYKYVRTTCPNAPLDMSRYVSYKVWSHNRQPEWYMGLFLPHIYKIRGREIHNMEFVIVSSVFTNVPVVDQLRMLSMNRKRKKAWQW